MPLSDVHVILNPQSAAGQAGRRHDEVVRQLRALGVEPVVKLTQFAGHAVALAQESAASGAAVVVAAGGDGTVHDVANGILTAGTDAALAVLPLGTGNDFAKMVPGAGTPAGAIRAIAGRQLRRFDVGQASWPEGEEFFVNGMGTGIDVEVVRQIRRIPSLPGPVQYLIGLAKALLAYDPISVHALRDGVRSEHSVMMMAIGNGACQGGGFYLTPAAQTDDGQLDLCIIDALPLWKVPLVLPRVLRGTHQGHPSVHMMRVRQIRFEAVGAAPLYFQLDGELREPRAGEWLNITIKPAALRVVTGAETAK